jgi:hypothetical protein
MRYYIRFIQADDREISLSDIESGLQAADPAYSIQPGAGGRGAIKYGTGTYGEISIHRPPSEVEIQVLRAGVESTGGTKKRPVLKALTEAKALVVTEVLWEDRSVDATLEKLDALWQWLLTKRKGLLQVDGEGYYSPTGLILELD